MSLTIWNIPGKSMPRDRAEWVARAPQSSPMFEAAPGTCRAPWRTSKARASGCRRVEHIMQTFTERRKHHIGPNVFIGRPEGPAIAIGWIEHRRAVITYPGIKDEKAAARSRDRGGAAF
jgi:hypothetical protein